MLMQLLVLNYVYLGGYIMPILYVLFILMLPTTIKRIPLLLIAFFTGLLVDIMSGALGFHALACLVVAMARILFADRILTRGENTEVLTPGIHTVSPQYFVSYLLLMYGIFYFVFFTAELFSFRGLGGVLLSTVLSTLVATLLSVIYQIVFTKKEEIL